MRNLSEIVLDNPIQTNAGSTPHFLDRGPNEVKYFKSLTADLDAQLVCLDINGKGKFYVPFSKVKYMKVAMGVPKADEE